MFAKLFDFSLTKEQEKRAKTIHEESIIIDMLFQGPLSPNAISDKVAERMKKDCEKYKDDPSIYISKTMDLGIEYASKGELPEFKECWYKSGITVGNRQLSLDNLEEALTSIGIAEMQFRNFDWLIKATNASDIIRAKKEGKKAGLITCQESKGIGTNLDLLDVFYNYGLRVIQLTYNPQDYVGAGCTERTNAGITNFGVKFIERMNKLGIIVDTSHCGKQTTLDACELSTSTVIASHTAVKRITPHARGKSDEELIAIAKTGGVIGVVTVPHFVCLDGNNATMEHVLDHIDYIVDLVGIEHVGIGTDWPMSMPMWAQKIIKTEIAPMVGFRKEDALPSTETVEGMSDYRQFINFTRGLVSRGYSDDDIKKILGGNWLRVFENVCG